MSAFSICIKTVLNSTIHICCPFLFPFLPVLFKTTIYLPLFYSFYYRVVFLYKNCLLNIELSRQSYYFKLSQSIDCLSSVFSIFSLCLCELLLGRNCTNLITDSISVKLFQTKNLTPSIESNALNSIVSKPSAVTITDVQEHTLSFPITSKTVPSKGAQLFVFDFVISILSHLLNSYFLMFLPALHLCFRHVSS